MPMIDVYVPDDLFSSDADRQLATDLTFAVLRAEGHTEPVIGPFYTENTAAFVHRLPQVTTAAEPAARAVRIQVITPPDSLDREGQRELTREATRIVTDLAGEGVQTWVVITEAAEGGWGLFGTAFGKPEFAALAAKAAASRDAG